MTATILEQIGNTPLVEIKKLNPNSAVTILAKLEYLNPGGSIKDRAALAMIEAGEKAGELTSDKTVIEATSGNTGIGLALVCAVKGYKLLLAMSEAVSQERQKILRARGADILLTPAHLGTDGAIEEVYRLYRENRDRYFIADQFNNTANWEAHYNGTANEIWTQTGGQLTKLVATMGTTGTLMGLARRLKELNEQIEVVGVEPYLGHKIQGLKNMKEAYRPEIYQKERLDAIVNIDDDEAFECARQLARQEGLMVGMSSGAAMAIAAEQARQMSKGTIVVIFPDSGERYLSTALYNVKEEIGLSIYNTLTRNKQPFKPILPGKVHIYSCGPTVHDRMHLGELRRMVFADLLCRYLAYKKFEVKHVMNLTDLDDKTIAGSQRAGKELKEYTEHYIQAFEKDLRTLRIRPAAKNPKVSEHVDDMVMLAQKLVQKGYAYEKLRSLYFNIGRYETYGRLSGINLNKIKLGATVDLDDYEKDNPRDFTLLKRARLSELKRGIFTSTDWGNIRPSLHIQCAAIAMKYLGATFDIHTSSRELIFPHHENEAAVASAVTGKPLANYWVHCERVLANGKAIAHAEEGFSLPDLVAKGFSGREIRYLLLSSHYRKPVIFNELRLLEARRALKRLDSVMRALEDIDADQVRPQIEIVDQIRYDLKNGFNQALDDDLNIAQALAFIFTVVRQINTLIADGQLDGVGAQGLLAEFKKIDEVLRILDFDQIQPDAEVDHLIRQREKARELHDWELADKLRLKIEARGIHVKDKKISDDKV
jgi:cysteinyl-tRNA synthetase